MPSRKVHVVTPQPAKRDTIREFSPSRRGWLRLGFCLASGIAIGVIEQFSRRREWRDWRRREIERDPRFQKLLGYLQLPDDGFADVALRFASQCHLFGDDPRMVQGCQRLARIALARESARGDAVLVEAVTGLWALGRHDLVREVAVALTGRADFVRARATLADLGHAVAPRPIATRPVEEAR